MQQLFGQKVLNDFIQKQDEKLIENRWQKYKNFLAKKEKISSWIETDYQDGFLEDIFENCLGYISKTRSTDEHYTLEREKKNETNAQKADGALLVDDKVVAVIELKDLKTKDLDKKYNRDESAVRQAFGYLQYNNHAKYVIVSNFNELRFYFDKATAYEQFFLFDLDYEGFKKLHTILSYESISKNLPQDIKEKSLNFEQDISNKLYKDYTNFRTHLFENVLKNNKDIDKLSLLNATQKLIDRIVFILFGEDTDLLPKNTIGTIIQRQKEVKKLVKTFTLYDSYKVYFEAINAGDEDLDITMYNGGLFAHDTFLDALVIDDEVLDARAKILSAYNFGSDISVNILGHIFENSISELEEMSAQLLDNDFDKKQSKRKKDGVFYTPAYITEYIVQNTLGKLCETKRAELNIAEVEAIVNPKKPTKKELETKENLLTYKGWLFDLKILDPACGSGAFLNQALEYLLKEHTRLQNDLALMGDLFTVYEVEKEVLEHNLYGVDINEGAVEIARLSLWLRTAKRGRPLTKLANKIKVGNSLIDDKTVVTNAFDWQVEFPEVFAQGGFDVVIGNPPYVTRTMTSSLKDMLKNNFKTAQYQVDLYVVFMEKGILLTKDNGYISYIVPNSWLKNLMMSECRKFLLDNLNLDLLVPNLSNVFDGASVDTMIFVGSKKITKNEITIAEFINESVYFKHTINQNRFLLNEGYIFDVEVNESILPIINKMTINTSSVEKLFDVIRGINPYDKYQGQSQDIIKTRAYHSDTRQDETFVPELKGQHTSRYIYTWDKKHFISYGNWLAAPRNIKYFEGERIIFREILGKTLVSTLITEDFKIDRSLYIAKLEESEINNFDIKYVLGILNSTLMAFYFRYSNNEFDNLFPKIRVAEFKKLPIKNIDFNSQKYLSSKIELILRLNKNLQETKQNFTNELSLEKLTKKLQNFEELTFDEFITEYTKSLKLKFADKLAERNFKQEWQAIFENDKTLACGFKTEIEQTDKEIDKMVYELYGLSDDEIKIVEGNND